MNKLIVTTMCMVPLLLGTGIGLEAQITGTLSFEVSNATTYFDDCDPGTACLVVYCGNASGTMTMEYVGFDGVFDHYDVTAVNWTLLRTLCGGPPAPTAIALTGTGTFEIDRAATPSQRLELSLLGLLAGPVTYTSGLVVPTIPFPNFSDFEIVSAPTAETLMLSATLLPGTPFTRGDVNADGNINISDPIFSLAALFTASAPPPPCLDAADANDDGNHNIADPLYVLGILFGQGTPIPPLNCGDDPTVDSLECATFPGCP